jgi:mannose-1-phosphate guanylyltransferase
MKNRLSLTLDKRLVRIIDSMVSKGFKSRSHAIEYLLNNALERGMIHHAFVLAGGEGTRLRPLTYEIPKPLIPVKNKPIIQYQIELFRKYGVNNVTLAVGYLHHKIQEYFSNGEKHGINLKYAVEESPLGTGGGLRLVKDSIDGPFVMTNGDNLVNIDLKDMYNFHKKNNAAITIALTPVEDVSAFGVAALKGGKIIKFIEKPKKEDAPSNLINAGVYIIEPDVINMIPEGACSIERDIFPKIAKMGKLFGYKFNGQWFPTDNQERYERAIKEWRGIK